jgi:hypothetical protein
VKSQNDGCNGPSSIFELARPLYEYVKLEGKKEKEKKEI